MKRPLVNPLDPNANKETAELADFYKETLGFTPNSLFTMMHRPRISLAFQELNKAVMENKVIFGNIKLIQLLQMGNEQFLI